MTKLSQESVAYIGARSADIVTPATGIYVSVGTARRIYAAAIAAAALGSGKTLTVQLKQATDSSGTSAKNLGSAVTVAEPTVPVEAEAFADQLDTANGFGYVAVTISSNNGSAVAGAAVLLLDQNRYN